MIKRQEMVANVADRTGVDPLSTGRVIDAFFEALTEYLSDGEAYNVPRFATFKPVHRAARVGRNPSTSERVHVPAQNSVKLVISDHLKRELNRPAE